MRLVSPPVSYSQRVETERNRQIEQADRENLKTGRDVEIGGGRLILTNDEGERYEVYVDASGALATREIGGLAVSSGEDIRQAERVVFSTYGDTVSVIAKAKNLNKFGRNQNVGTSFETIAELQGTTANETFVTTNLIDSISSDDAADTGITFTVEGHTIDGSGNLTFVTQDVTTDGSDGRTKVTLATPMARANRGFVKASGTFGSPQSALAGNIYIYDDTDGVTAGVPNTASATKAMIIAGETQSEKAATSISSADYWFLSYITAAVGEAGGSASRIIVRIETRDVVNGGVWRPIGRDIILDTDQTGRSLQFLPYLIIPKNHDVRAVAKTDSNTAEIVCEFGGYLASVQ